MPVIGSLDSRSPDAIAERLRAYRQGLKETGYVEGENLTILYRPPKIKSIGCRNWRRIWFAVRSP